MGGWHSRLDSDTAGYMVAYKILVSAPVPLELIGPLDWVGLGWGLGTKGLGTGLDNIVFSGEPLYRIFHEFFTYFTF